MRKERRGGRKEGRRNIQMENKANVCEILEDNESAWARFVVFELPFPLT